MEFIGGVVPEKDKPRSKAHTSTRDTKQFGLQPRGSTKCPFSVQPAGPNTNHTVHNLGVWLASSIFSGTFDGSFCTSSFLIYFSELHSLACSVRAGSRSLRSSHEPSRSRPAPLYRPRPALNKRTVTCARPLENCRSQIAPWRRMYSWNSLACSGACRSVQCGLLWSRGVWNRVVGSVQFCETAVRRGSFPSIIGVAATPPPPPRCSLNPAMASLVGGRTMHRARNCREGTHPPA